MVLRAVIATRSSPAGQTGGRRWRHPLLSRQQLVLVSSPDCGRVPLQPVRLADLPPLSLVPSSHRHAMRDIVEGLDLARLCINPIARPKVGFDYFLIRPTCAPLSVAAEKFVACFGEELDAIALRRRDLVA